MQRLFFALPIAALVGLAMSSQGAAAATRPASMHVTPSGLGSARAQSRPVVHDVRNVPEVSGQLWVSNTAPIGADTSCTHPGYNTISAALLAAGVGATINVCSGTYNEQLAIIQPVHLVSLGAVSVEGPSSPADNITTCDADGGAQPNQDVVDICTAGAVSITGFAIEGNWPASICNDSLYGVDVLGGADLTMSNSTVGGAGGDPQTDGCQGGVGIEVGESLTTTSTDIGTATLTNDIVNTYQKNGITIDGVGSSAVLKADTVTGTGPTPALGQNGIQVSDGATASITGALVSGDECEDTAGDCGPGAFDTQAVGILLYDAGKTTVSNSTVNNCDDGIYNLEGYPTPNWAPPVGWTPVNDTFKNMSLNNRYENAAFDAGKSTLTGSTLTGGEAGIQVYQYSAQPISAVATASKDTITGATVAAVQVASDQSAGDFPVKLSVTTSGLDTSNAAGVQNQSTSIVTATKDWWGDGSGPSVWSFGVGSSVTSDVNFFPWSLTSAIASFEGCSIGNTETTTANDVVLCATAGTGNAYLANAGSGAVLLIGNKGNDTLVGTGNASGETWIIGGNPGNNTINGSGGTGFIQERGNGNDTLIGTSNDTVAAN
jgi:hypothetical protein